MKFLTLALLVGGGLYLYNQSQSKITTVTIKKDLPSPPNTNFPNFGDRGFKIIIPCKEYEIYNEKATYQYVYKLSSYIIKNSISEENLEDLFNIAIPEIFGCTSEQIAISQIEYNSKYYKWFYNIGRATIKGMFETLKGSAEEANLILNEEIQNLKSKNLDIIGLSTNINDPL